MEIGSAYKWMKPRLEAVAQRSTSPEFKAETALALETFERVKAFDGLQPSLFGLRPGDQSPNHEVTIAGKARLWDHGDRLEFRHQTTTLSGLGESSRSYYYDAAGGTVYVEKHQNTQDSYLSVFGPWETQQSFTLDLVTGTIADMTPWTNSPVLE